MDPRTQERVEEWDSRPFSGGFDGLSDLADADFSGTVSAAGTWLWMLNGRIVGVIDGDIEDFETASGTQYDAPHPSLPLLCTMEEQGGETRAKYYTNETPLREVDSTLQSGSFTGYIELSENVLSGDYYAVYYGGRRMAAAYIGNAERLLTGDEAFERAADEVGIYEVVDVEIDVVDVPETADDDDGETTASPTASDTADASTGGVAAADGSVSDSTGSSVDPIDVSSSEPTAASTVTGTDATDDDTDDASPLSAEPDRTVDQPGITAPDGSDPDTDPRPAGITDSEPAGAGTRSEQQAAETDATAAAEVESTATTPDSSSNTSSTDDSSTAADDGTESAASSSATDRSTSDAETGSSVGPAGAEPAAEERDRTGDDETATGPSSDSTALESTQTAGDDGLEEEFEREEAWRETRRIPSIDPDNDETSSDSSAGGRERRMDQPSTATDSGTAESASNAAHTDERTTEVTASTASAASTSESQADRTQTQQAGRTTDDTATDARSDRLAALTEKLETLQEQRDALTTKADELETERDRLRSENDELSATVERLQSRIDDLETEIEQARTRDAGGTDSGAATNAGTQLSPQRALSQTNLFVRYTSKSQPTLETAHDSNADRSEVASNLRLEHHTGFDASDAIVDGQSYDEFLETTMEYRFVDWLTEMLLYEIRDTGNADGLGDLYDAIPKIDRAELGATISLADDDTDDVPEEVTFDIVAFDKMGNPLLLVTLNDSREPATKDLLAEFEEAASAVKANYPDLAAAIAVTSSYFEPGALEVAEQATSSGFLSRSSKLSYVNISRKSGYHLCLVESRSEGFHMNIPEL